MLEVSTIQSTESVELSLEGSTPLPVTVQWRNLKKTNFRFVVLLLVGFIQLLSYTCDQAIMPIQTEIIAYFNANNIKYNLFFSLDGYLCIILCFCAGSLLHKDKLGINSCLLTSSLLIVCGNLCCCISATR